MPDPTAPYRSYNYVIYLNRPWETLLGGFQEVAGLSQESVANYRAGNWGSPVRAPRTHKVGDITLKRGVVNSGDLWSWIMSARASEASARCDAIVTLQNEAGTPVQSWKLNNATPTRYTGPTLGSKGGSDVAMEELILSAESIEWVPPH